MAFYFFHLHDGNDVVVDEDGRELHDIAAVRKAALFEARAIIAEETRGGCIDINQRIEVAIAAGEIVHRLPFCDAVTMIGWPH